MILGDSGIPGTPLPLNEVPDCIDKAALKLAGQGERNCHFSMDEADPCVFRQLEYPKLREAGGYKIMKHNRALELFPLHIMVFSRISKISYCRLIDYKPVDVSYGILC